MCVCVWGGAGRGGWKAWGAGLQAGCLAKAPVSRGAAANGATFVAVVVVVVASFVVLLFCFCFVSRLFEEVLIVNYCNHQSKPREMQKKKSTTKAWFVLIA